MTDAPARVAIVTGASGGIGRAVALRLARDGFAVVLNYAGNAAQAESAVAEIKAAGGQGFAVKAEWRTRRLSIASSRRRSAPSAGSTWW
jgi:3-oxoacyl-[acyl-carrier protein] reductase